MQTLRFGSYVTAKSETGHSGVAEWRDRFAFENRPSRRDSRTVVREGLLSRDVTGSIQPLHSYTGPSGTTAMCRKLDLTHHDEPFTNAL